MMNVKTITLSTLCFLTIGALLFNSCRTRERDIDITEGQEAVMLERTNDDIISIVHQAETGFLSNYGCATISKNTVAVPNTLTVDFGVAPCICNDGKIRNGKINVAYTGNFADSGSNRVITLENFTVDTNKVSGHKTLITSKNSLGNITIAIESMDTVIKKKTGELVTGISTRTREYINGCLSTAQWIDDKYLVTGNGSGTRANGFNFTSKISKPLQAAFDCVPRFTSGEMQIQPQGKEIRILNFGDGNCDKNATIFINNKAYNIDFE